jgi:hypothetical protein
MVSKLKVYGQTTQRKAEAGLYHEGQRIMERSRELVPVDTGLLRSTGITKLPYVQPTIITVELNYGGAGLAPYAAVVHENLAARHPHGQAKYLEQPLNESVEGMAERLAREIR